MTPIARAQQAMQSAADVRHAWLYEAGERLKAERLGDAASGHSGVLRTEPSCTVSALRAPAVIARKER